jgi:hypothetical protein
LGTRVRGSAPHKKLSLSLSTWSRLLSCQSRRLARGEEEEVAEEEEEEEAAEAAEEES